MKAGVLLPPDFAPLDGAIFWPAGEGRLECAWVLRVGRYMTADGPTAIWVETDAGEKVDNVTVNLAEECPPPGHGRVHVKVHGFGREAFLQKVLNTGLLEVDGTQPVHSAGFVLQYAETWRLAGDADHIARQRVKLAAEVQLERDRRLAKDAAKRLTGRAGRTFNDDDAW